MLINSNQDNNSFPSVDICIIGSGISASSLAIELLNTDISFLMIEAGPLKYSSSKMIKKESVGHDFGLKSTTSIEVGGTSSLWHGVLAPLDKIDFKERSWISNSGWPITYEDLVPFYKKAGKILKLSNFDYFTVKKLPKNLSNLLAYLKFDKNILENKIFQRPMPVIRFKEVLISKLKDSKVRHIYYNACALELVQDNSIEIKKLICGNENGQIFEVSANKFVVCAGALETPRLLLNSSIKNKNIGRYLMDHPMGSLRQIQFKKKHKAHIYSYVKPSPELMIKSGLRFTESAQKSNKLPNHCFYTKVAYSKGIDSKTERVLLSLLTFRDGGLSFRDIWNVITNIRLVLFIVIYKLNLKYKYADLFFVTEQTPNPDSRVSLSDKKDKFGYPIAKINWQLLEGDLLSMKKTLNILQSQAFSGNSIKFVSSTVDLDWNEIYTSAAHHLGTARMSTSSDNGVVDENLKVFGMNNLFICDGSVFPTSGNANSSFTTSALACRLADYLIKSR
jgi:hypothetical protein